MQPLHNSSPRGSKIMLKRMSRVRSDEKDTEEAKDELHDKTPSPIGAGLPLLQRLRLLKEKQVSWTPQLGSLVPSLPLITTTNAINGNHFHPCQHPAMFFLHLFSIEIRNRNQHFYGNSYVSKNRLIKRTSRALNGATRNSNSNRYSTQR